MKKNRSSRKSKTTKTAKSSDKDTLPEPLAALIDILARQSAKEFHENMYGVHVDPYLLATFTMKGK